MDLQIRKTVFQQFSYGLYVVTVKDDDAYAAATVTWLSQASFDPPLIMMGMKKESGTHAQVSRVGRFAVNIVGEGQKDIAAAFFKETNIDGDTINGYKFVTGETGAPILCDTPCYLECTVREIIEGGDHDIVIAEAIAVGVNNETPSQVLRDTGWSYGR
jgi:flavin reductase (DIM6/NTAB) family NADH-FMN oxidoreductase RutF